MKRFCINISILILAGICLTGCYKLQKDYEYRGFVLDPNIKITAKEFLLSRGSAGVGSDTIFKLMQQGLEYANFDMSEFEKPGRTFILLHNNAIRTTTGTGPTFRVTGGFFFDYPIIGKDASGNILKSKLEPTQDSLRAALSWQEYPQELVKNYFLYLILQGEYSFENLKIANTSIQTLLPAGTVAGRTDTKLGWVVTKSTPNPDDISSTSITFNPAAGTGFDPEGKMNLKLVNNQNAPINVNDRADDRSAGYFATNGKVHVFDRTIHPFRYSY